MKKLLEQIEKDLCRWPGGGMEEESCDKARATFGVPYCHEHMKVAYTPARRFNATKEKA